MLPLHPCQCASGPPMTSQYVLGDFTRSEPGPLREANHIRRVVPIVPIAQTVPRSWAAPARASETPRPSRHLRHFGDAQTQGVICKDEYSH